MKVHLLQVPAEGLHIEGQESEKIFDLKEPGLRPAGPVDYSLDVGTNSEGLWATGKVGADFEFECNSCLRWFKQRVEVPDFATQIELEGRELVDLTDSVREDILLALPPYPRCDSNGSAACPGNRLLKSEAEPETSQTPAADAVWGTLDQLKLKQNE